MDLSKAFTASSTRHPGKTLALIAALTVFLAALAVLPSLFPQTFSFFHPVRVDTDPENMLRQDEPARVFHNRMKETFNLNDMIVVGVVNEEHPQGVFNPETLHRVHELTEFAQGLRGDAVGADDPQAGVVRPDIIAPSTVDNIEQAGVGTVRFEWLMSSPPQTFEEAAQIRDNAQRIPFLDGTLVSEDGKALAIYLPITAKKLSYDIWSQLNQKIETFSGEEKWHITGLPVANDVFGVEMFKQMAISAPLAMLVIFLLMLFFFRQVLLIISPMIVALVSVVVTMSALVASGNTIHIMSSMIPIFIMPIAVLDSIHILSEFFDRYQSTRDRVQTIKGTVQTLFLPMLYTSITSAAGFASLALTPIPPVQVFGLFVALGVLLAWALTLTVIPAYVMFIPEKRLQNFGTAHTGETAEPRDILTRMLQLAGGSTYRRAKVYLGFAGILVGIGLYGISLIQINDNPTKWFEKDHSIRVADRVLNDHFGGTYTAYLCLRPEAEMPGPKDYVPGFISRLSTFVQQEAMEPGTEDLEEEVAGKARTLASEVDSKSSLLEKLRQWIEAHAEQSSGDTAYAWEEFTYFLDQEAQRGEVFKRPDVLNYMADLQAMLQETGEVGKSNALTDIVKTVHRELLGTEEAFSIPDSARAVGQTLVTYQSSHRPQDLWHFVTPDYRRASLWVQLKSGDNKDMSRVVQAVDSYMQDNPPPVKLEKDWFGLTYINVVWQDKMVSGMLKAFLGSFLVVLLMMIVLFRSGIWGLLSMVPLTVTVILIYGIIGLVGKDYDMPVAVLSSLTIGLAVDFAIHFLVRSRRLQERIGNWKEAVPQVFSEPARAILRNVLVIAIGFTPLLAAPLVPYQTVGLLMASILFLSGAITLCILPALITMGQKLLFPQQPKLAFACRCGTMALAGLCVGGLVVVNLIQFVRLGWTGWTGISLAGVLIFMGVCWFMSRRVQCGTE
ncbi:efflux RND transporter permease subunit [Desulfovermiculus halophilus]|uniref:efflux RND transporter permease subunit n=1 Tax=Desulfovermiculus halophilus TaxID=339722 RepID=UPI0006890A42|nr:MMPL family transporter [Desulfovermiculus halophilus]